MNNTSCIFYRSATECKILREKKCTRCKFAKTEQQYYDSIQKTKMALDKKGLEAFEKITPDGKHIMSVRKV